MTALARIPFLDIAYQGFGDGLAEDAFSLRALVDAGMWTAETCATRMRFIWCVPAACASPA